MHLKGKSAIVTGAGRGIGRDIALLLAKEGASVIVNDPGVGRGGEATTERPADDVVAEIKAAGGKAQANYDSVADYQKAGAMVRRCVDDYGKIDILVNVAGMLREKMIWNMSEDDFDCGRQRAPQGALEHVASRHQVHAQRRPWPHHQFLLRRLQGLGRPVQLLGREGRHHRPDPLDRQGVRQVRHHRQCDLPRRRHAHDDERRGDRQPEAQARRGPHLAGSVRPLLCRPRPRARRAADRLSRAGSGRLHQRPPLPCREGPHQHLRVRRRLQGGCTTTARCSRSTN